MKSIFACAMILVMTSAFCMAGDWRPLETKQEARQRHSSERYQGHQRKRDRNPMHIPNSYNERLGDTAPRGTTTPGRKWKGPYRDDQKHGRHSFERWE